MKPPPLQALPPLQPQMTTGFSQGTEEPYAEFVNPEQYM